MKKVRINDSVIEDDESKKEKQKKSCGSKHIDRAINERDIDTWAKIIVRKQKGKKWHREKMMIQMSRLSNKSFLPPRKTKKRQKKNEMEEK